MDKNYAGLGDFFQAALWGKLLLQLLKELQEDDYYMISMSCDDGHSRNILHSQLLCVLFIIFAKNEANNTNNVIYKYNLKKRSKLDTREGPEDKKIQKLQK